VRVREWKEKGRREGRKEEGGSWREEGNRSLGRFRE
jgi:hypothetical protein